jgi:hypothetical protein
MRAGFSCHSRDTPWFIGEGTAMARNIGTQMILAEWLFVETVADVRHRSQNPGERSRYELLGIAPLLRKLLLDGASLVDTVRAGRPEALLEFRVRPWRAPATDAEAEAGTLPHALRLGGPELVGGPDDPAVRTVRGFVGARIGMVEGQDLTIRDVVRYYANVEGGVHFGKPKEAEQATFSSMAPLLLGHTTGQIEILAHIGQVVVNALTPLCDSILTSPTIDRRLHHLNEAGFYDGHWTADHFRASSRRTGSSR